MTSKMIGKLELGQVCCPQNGAARSGFSFGPLFHIAGFQKCRKTWVFALSFEYFSWVFGIFPWVLSFFLEFWVLSLRFEFLLMFCVFVAPTQSLSQLNLNLPPLLQNTIFNKKCRNFEFSAWVSVFSLSFEFYSPWGFIWMAKGEACVKFNQ